MSERPTVPEVADQLYDELAVSQPADGELGWPFLILLAGFAAAMGELPGIVRDTDDGPGYSALLDPDRAPLFALAWLAQFAGVTLTPGAGEAAQRAQIANPPAFDRGTPDAIRQAAQRTLTGTKFVGILERDGSPWLITVVTRTSETPDPAVTERAVRAQKAVGLLLTYVAVSGMVWNEATSTWDTAPAVTWNDTATTSV